MVTVASLKNDARASGYNGVATHPSWRTSEGERFRAQVNHHHNGGRNWYGPTRGSAKEAAQDYADYINRKPLTPADLVNPKRKSGYNHVNSAMPGRNGHKATTQKWRAASGAKKVPGDSWRGPVRKKPETAAQDYCNWYNNQLTAPAPKLKSAGHSVSRTPRKSSDEAKELLAEKRRVDAELTKLRKKQQGYLYLIGEEDAQASHMRNVTEKFVKIGFSVNPQARIATLQTGNPRKLAILGTIKGTPEDEAKLHQQFIHHNVLQEWFRPTPALLSHFNIEEV